MGNERGDMIADLMDIKRIIKKYVNNSMPTGLITLMKWTNFMKNTICQIHTKRNKQYIYI